MENNLWKYNTHNGSLDFLRSLHLTDSLNLASDNQLAFLYALSNHAQNHYSQVFIPKKNGKKRKLLIPDYLLKQVQTNILKHILVQFPVSPYATAYKSGCSTVFNAFPHLNQKLLLKLDIHDFFGSITYIDVYQKVFKSELFPPSVRTLLTHLCCYHDALPQGAPSSPYISNLILKPFDNYIGNWCKKQQITYTRYCDDMTFSGDFNPVLVKKKVQSFLMRLGFSLNPEKTHVCSQKNRQEVTGLVVNQKLQTSKEYRRRIRQECYYIKKFGLKDHLAHIGYKKGETHYLQSLNSKINYILYVNPSDSEFLLLKKELSSFFQV